MTKRIGRACHPAPLRRRAPGLAGAVLLPLALAACVVPDAGRPYPSAPRPEPGPREWQRAPPPQRPAPALPERTGRLRVAPERVEFGAVDVGGAARERLTLGNEGWGPLRIDAVEVVGDLGFEVERDLCTGRTLGPREECDVGLRFSPVSSARVSGLLRVATSDPRQPLTDLLLAGAGRPSRHGSASLSPERLAFGRVQAGGERILEARVRNRGGGRLRVRAASAEGRAFRIVADLCSRADLEAGQECRIAVQFSPPRRDDFAGTLRVVTDDPGSPEVAIELAGEGSAARSGCPQQRLELLGSDRSAGDRLLVTGRLPRGRCITYAVRVPGEGRLVLCVPEGYRLEAAGFEHVPGGSCDSDDDRHPPRMYRSALLSAGADVDDLTIWRRENAPAEFSVVVTFQPRRGSGAEQERSDSGGGTNDRPGPRPFPSRR